MEKDLKTHQTIYLVDLSDIQIKRAKQINGVRKKITHGLVCGAHGRMFGTEKQCRKNYAGWLEKFPQLFANGIETNNYVITKYDNTPDLEAILSEIHETLVKLGQSKSNAKAAASVIDGTKKELKSFFSRFIGG